MLGFSERTGGSASSMPTAPATTVTRQTRLHRFVLLGSPLPRCSRGCSPTSSHSTGVRPRRCGAGRLRQGSGGSRSADWWAAEPLGIRHDAGHVAPAPRSSPTRRSPLGPDALRPMWPCSVKSTATVLVEMPLQFGSDWHGVPHTPVGPRTASFRAPTALLSVPVRETAARRLSPFAPHVRRI